MISRTFLLLPYLLFLLFFSACGESDSSSLAREKAQKIEDLKSLYEPMLDYFQGSLALAGKKEVFKKGKEIIKAAVILDLSVQAQTLKDKALFVITRIPKWFPSDLKELMVSSFLMASDAHSDQSEAVDLYLIYAAKGEANDLSKFSQKIKSYTSKMSKLDSNIVLIQERIDLIQKSL